jgi:ERCC4-related helicase
VTFDFFTFIENYRKLRQKLSLIVIDKKICYRTINSYSRADFRVVALSATPGSDLQAVRLMLQNLLISRIELRSEESPDIVPYTFQRKVEKVVVPLGQELAG